MGVAALTYGAGMPFPPRRRVSSGSPFETTIGFSRALRVDDRVLVSGTAPVFPDGSCPDDAALQARRCFAIIETALAEAGAALRDVAVRGCPAGLSEAPQPRKSTARTRRDSRCGTRRS